MAHAFGDVGVATSMASLRARFGRESWWGWFAEVETLNDEAPAVRVVDGPLVLAGDLVAGDDPWALIVDGSLTLGGTLECFTAHACTSALIVTGAVQAANLFYGGSARLGLGPTTVDGFVVGTWGDDGASLSVEGVLRARGLLLDSHTPADAGAIAAIVMAAVGWRGLVPDVIDGETDLFVAEVLDRGGPFVDLAAVRAAARAGRPVFVAEREAAWRARKRL